MLTLYKHNKSLQCFVLVCFVYVLRSGLLILYLILLYYSHWRYKAFDFVHCICRVFFTFFTTSYEPCAQYQGQVYFLAKQLLALDLSWKAGSKGGAAWTWRTVDATVRQIAELVFILSFSRVVCRSVSPFVTAGLSFVSLHLGIPAIGQLTLHTLSSFLACWLGSWWSSPDVSCEESTSLSRCSASSVGSRGVGHGTGVCVLLQSSGPQPPAFLLGPPAPHLQGAAMVWVLWLRPLKCWQSTKLCSIFVF